MKNINQENDLQQQHIQHQQEDNHHQEKEEKQEPNHQEDEGQESEQLAEEPEHQENLEQETEQSMEEEEQKKKKTEEKLIRPEPVKQIPLTTMPSSPPLSPMSPPPNKPASPPDSARSPDHTSYPAHAISPPPSTLSSYQTTYSYNYNHVESSPPPLVLKTTPPPPPPSTTKSEGTGVRAGAGGVAGSGRKLRPNLSVLRRAKMENIKRRTLLAFRIFAFLFCLVSLSVMAADKNQGWALDSFHHYKEFRYCMSVNVIGFVYSGLQAYDLAYSLTTGKQVVRNQFRCLLDFSLDQILAYLLLSASSSSAFRVEDWESNWGKDKFPAMARASVALSFLGFVAFALSSLLSGYTLFTPHSW